MYVYILKKNIFIFLPLLIVFIITCGDGPSGPTSFNFEDFPTAPTNVRASLGDGTLVLSWSHPKVEDVESYKIYRQDSTGQIFRNIGATELLTYSDTNLQNNREYRYKISAVGKNGLEGQKSDVVSGTPAIYGVTINSGVEYT
ncbi:MAG: fibronectin type III domain-containing protein, partial [bacterium]